MRKRFKCIKNILSVLLVILLVMTCGSMTMLVSMGLDTLIHRANADDEENAVLAEGTWKNSLNQDVRYTITKQGVMTVSLSDSSQQGPMDMADTPGKMKANISGEQPYYKYKDYIKEVIISEGITEIGDRAFEGKSYTNHADREGFDAFMSITKVSCANNTTLKRIGIAAFQNCQNVVEVDLSGCSSLEEIAGKDAKNDKDPTWSEGDNLNPYEATGAYGYVEEGAFSDCIKLVTVNVTGCTSLKIVGDGAFHNGKANNTFLSQFDFEDLTSLEVIGVAAFKDNKTKNTIDFTRFEDIRVIDSMAFRSNVGVVTVDLSGRTSLTRLGAEAFYQAGVAATIKSVDLSGCTGLTVLETRVLANSSSGEIESVNLSGCKNITEIKKFAFQNQKKLTHIDIPEGVTTIDKDAFANCTSLKSITWNAVNYSTSNSAKYLFPKLEELYIGPAVTELPEKFFANLSLDSVSIAFAPRSENQTIRMKFPFGSNTDTNSTVLEYTIDENGYVWYGGDIVFPPEEIRNNPMNLVPPTPRQLVYNGSEQSLIDEANPGRVSAGSRIEYRVNDDTDWSTALPKATNAGTYKIYYRAVNETDTTIITEGNTPVITTIGKIKNPVNVDESEVSVSQGDKISFADKIISGLPAETTSISYGISNNNGGKINTTTGLYEAGNNIVPGSYYITIKFPESPNYNETIIRIPLVVGGGKVKVTFNKNSGIGSFPTQTINIGEAASEPSNQPTRTGYHFDYWYLSLFNGNNVSATNNGQAYDFSTLLISSITLTAHWTPIKYTIAFDSNGGTGSMEPQNFDYGTNKNLTANAFSKDNCIFLGWSTVADGDVVYSDKESVGNLTEIEGNTITLYAKWGEFSVTMSESVVYDGQAHSVYVAADASTSLEYRIDGSDVWLSENPTFIIVGNHKVYVRATFVTGKQLTYNGTLSITQKPVTITAASQSWTYDGSAHSNTTVTVTSGSLLTGDSLVATATGSVTNVADTRDGNNSVAAGYKIMHGTEDVTANYIITANAGTLSIHKRSITLKANDASSEYNGSGITYATATSAVPPYYSITNTAENEGLAPGQSITSIELSGNGTAVYEYTINIIPGSVIIGNYTSNYNITLESGTLSITKNTTAITVTPGSDSKVYDGTPLTKNDHDDFTVTGVPEGFTWTAKANGTVTNVTPGEGEKSENAVTEFKIFNANGEDVTEQFSNIDTSATGTLEITKRAVTLTSGSAEKPYDGSSLTKPGVTVGGDGFVAGEVSEIKATGSVTTVAEGEVTNTITFTEGASFKAKNYSITKNEGTLKITANMRTVVITSASKSWTYDGQTHTDEVYTVTYDGTACTADASGKVFTLPIGDTLTITPTAEGVKDYNSSLDENNTYSYSITNANSYGDVTANYGTLSIDKCPLTIKADNKTKEYDNDSATDPELTATVTGVVSGDTINYTLSRAEGQNVGEYAITVTSGNNSNYDVTVEAGTFSITAKEAALTWSDTEFPYDGKSHLPSATVSNLVDGDTCEVTVEGAKTEIGSDYTANATALSNPNYKLPADASTKFKIYGCTITFVDEDGTVLQSGIVEYGTKPSYTGKTPSKAATAQYSYEFLDWSPTITEVTGDKTYTAIYKPILNAYTVTWKDEDGTILETDKDVPYGTVPTYDGKEPTKAPTAEYSFKFDGWSIKVSEVTDDITYTATYAKSAIEYTVEAENLPEGTQLSFSGKETVEAGKVLTFKVLLADGYEATDDLVVTVNGTKIAPNADGSYTIPSVMTNSVISVTGVVKVDYNLTEGENAEYKQGESKNARFVFKRTVNDKVTFGRFTYAELDGKLLDPNNYTKTSGSLILELKKDFLDTLPVGEHLLKVYFSDDKEGVIAHFLISAGITPTVTVTVTPAPDSNPTTGDTSNPILWIILIGAAVLGLAGMIYSRSRMER